MEKLLLEGNRRKAVKNPEYITKIAQIKGISGPERKKLENLSGIFRFRSNDYYQSLIDWGDPNDPIRKISTPNEGEFLESSNWAFDASGEESYTQVPGLQHKYKSTALLLVNDVCGGFCRFCFRKRLFIDHGDEVVKDISKGLDYIKNHPEISNVLLTGGDPLVLSTGNLERIIAQLREVDHVKIVRIGSKMPAFNPMRITGDPKLLEMLSRYSENERKIYLMAHFNHPKELTKEAVEALSLLQKAGVITINQTPLLRGINDDPKALSELFEKLSFAGVPPYYVFQCRPTKGNEMFAVPMEEAFTIFQEAQSRCSGLAKRARFVMSHHSGKIEIVGISDENVFMKYHRVPKGFAGKNIAVLPRNSKAFWLDDYENANEALF